jgi:putative ABC transport system ATP-binding protein
LLPIIGCVLSATSGEVRLFDQDVSKAKESTLPDLRLAYVGFVFQGHNLLASAMELADEPLIVVTTYNSPRPRGTQ